MASDLHTHTNFSDGVLSPKELVEKFKNLGIKYLAITDHDTIDGVASLGKVKGLHLIPGVEITAQHPTNPSAELHIIGLNVDIHDKSFKSQLDIFANQRRERIEKMIDKLNELNYPITLQDVLAIAGNPKTVVRNHLAEALSEKGYFEKPSEAYKSLLDHAKPAYVPLKHPTASQAIDLIHLAGGSAVLAHPKLVRDDDLVEKIAQQVDGIEVYYPRHSWLDEQRYLAIARKYNLKLSGGSDFHGTPGDKQHPKEFGAFTVEDEIAEKWLE